MFLRLTRSYSREGGNPGQPASALAAVGPRESGDDLGKAGGNGGWLLCGGAIPYLSSPAKGAQLEMMPLPPVGGRNLRMGPGFRREGAWGGGGEQAMPLGVIPARGGNPGQLASMPPTLGPRLRGDDPVGVEHPVSIGGTRTAKLPPAPLRPVRGFLFGGRDPHCGRSRPKHKNPEIYHSFRTAGRSAL